MPSIVLLALCAALLCATPASAAKECVRKATVTDGTVLKFTDGTVGPDGAWQLDPAKTHTKLGRGVWVAHTAADIDFQGVDYALKRGSVFSLGCFGHTKAEGAIFPAVHLSVGSAVSTSEAGAPGGITTNEGLFDPYLEKALSLRVSRTGKGGATLDDLLAEGPEAVHFGTSKVARTKGKGTLNITPYVGRKPGVCVQASRATFTSKRRDAEGYMVGTSSLD